MLLFHGASMKYKCLSREESCPPQGEWSEILESWSKNQLNGRKAIKVGRKLQTIGRKQLKVGRENQTTTNSTKKG
jgi:hypothetical protein